MATGISGRMENQIKVDNAIQKRIAGEPQYINGYYYSLASKGHTTRSMYIYIVCQFLSMMKEKGVDVSDPKNFTVDNLNMYFNECKYTDVHGEIRPMSNTVLKTRYSCLNGFFKYLIGSGRMDKNPLDYIERAHGKDNVKRAFLDPKDLKRLIRTIKRDIDIYKDWRPVRDLAVIYILIVTGIRATALTEINTDDIKFTYTDNDNGEKEISGAIINVTDKENKFYQMALTKDCATCVNDWMKKREEILAEAGVNTDAMFITVKFARMYYREVAIVLDKYIKKTWGDEAKHITPHKLRASFANMLLKEKKDIYYVQKMMHHASPSTTELYIQDEGNDIEETSAIVGNLLE